MPKGSIRLKRIHRHGPLFIVDCFYKSITNLFYKYRDQTARRRWVRARLSADVASAAR